MRAALSSYYEKVGNRKPVNIDSELPFELPQGWTWARLTSLCSYLHRGKSPKYSEERKYPVFAQKCNQPDGITLEKVKFADPGTYSRYEKECMLRDHDIVVNSTGTGTLGRVGMFMSAYLGDYECIVPDSHVTTVRSALPELSSVIYWFLKSEYGQSLIFSRQTGSTNQKELPTKEIAKFPVPVPPFSEIERIAARVNKSFRLLKIEKSD